MSYHGLGGMSDPLIKTGFWWSADDQTNAQYPRVEAFIDPTWDRQERQLVLAYVRDRRHSRNMYRGWSECRICHTSNGSEDVSDGTYVWPSGFAHYIEHHQVKPHPEFIKHVLARVSRSH